MHNVFKVLKFELMSIFNKKAVRVTTLIMCVVVIIATSIPTFMEMFAKDEPKSPENEAGVNVDDLGFMTKSDMVSLDYLCIALRIR